MARFRRRSSGRQQPTNGRRMAPAGGKYEGLCRVGEVAGGDADDAVELFGEPG